MSLMIGSRAFGLPWIGFARGAALCRDRTGGRSDTDARGRHVAGEAEWVRLAKRGDDDAFRRLVDRYADRACEIALRVVRSPEEAEEAAQEAFLKAWTALPRFREEARFSTWLYRIVTRCALDRARMMKRRAARETAVEQEHLESFGGAGGDEGEQLTDLMLLERILGRLSAESRAVVTLHYLRDLPVNDVAETLGMPPGTVKTHLHRSRATLRRAWMRLAGNEGGRGP